MCSRVVVVGRGGGSGRAVEGLALLGGEAATLGLVAVGKHQEDDHDGQQEGDNQGDHGGHGDGVLDLGCDNNVVFGNSSFLLDLSYRYLYFHGEPHGAPVVGGDQMEVPGVTRDHVRDGQRHAVAIGTGVWAKLRGGIAAQRLT